MPPRDPYHRQDQMKNKKILIICQYVMCRNVNDMLSCAVLTVLIVCQKVTCRNVNDMLSSAVLILLNLRWTEINWIDLFSRATEVVLWCVQIHVILSVISRQAS